MYEVENIRFYPDLFSKEILKRPLFTVATVIKRSLGLWVERSGTIVILRVKKREK